MSLAKLQQQFFDFIVTAEPSIVGDIANSPRLSAEASLGIYREAYHTRLTEVLTEDYPGLCGLMGVKTFQQLCHAYIDQQPSTHFSLRYFGETLAKFLEQTNDEQGGCFSEMASFEWALATAFDAEDASLLTLDALAALPATAWPQLQLTLHPSVRIVDCVWNTPQLWQAVMDKQALPSPQKLATSQPWLVWRKNFMSHYQQLSEPESFIMLACQRQESFAEICEGLSTLMPAAEVAKYISQCLRHWVTEELFCQ